ncbi:MULTISPECIES: TRAP transporter large permease subunit [Sedimentibacter]|uniref:TRAP transporter large permease subunit n=1 Tax=Sedimentibacter hydroxybenzoicus DSM 7310 TaxID=1123245 RepID=A0A974BKE2_SEDHY|nr:MULTISPECIES: TRAP transporter large permease subunit [Sedimentibacter]NYB74486.1 TRAP transporter large permease subunit [Sedimentibacter hydroxybenzoicus DSM 7310]
MEWYIVLLSVFSVLLFIMLTGLPIAFSFILVSSVIIFNMQGAFGIRQLVLGMYDQVAQFSLTPIPFFMIMGEVFYQSGLVSRTLDSLAKFVKKVPGRLSIITLLGGGIFAALSGSVVANTAMFGSLMLPEMMKRGYSKSLITGSIMASGALAMVIPPSALAVLLGSIAGISVGKILIGAILPGVLLMVIYIGYIMVACIINPDLAPSYDVEESTLKEMILGALKDIVPLFFIFLVVMGIIFTGIGTPTEAAAIGALSSYILTIFYKKFSWKLVYKTLVDSLKVTSMVLIIIAGSAGFSQILAMTGASREAVVAIMGMSASPFIIISTMLIIIIALGFFMEQTAIMMITLPIMMPVIINLGTNQIWFAVLYLICLQIGQLTPPVGLALFTMKGVSPPEVTMRDVYDGAIPFVTMDILALVVMAAIPSIITWLPSLY